MSAATGRVVPRSWALDAVPAAMTTPPNRLPERLSPFTGTIDLLRENGRLMLKITYTEALTYIARAEVEGVGPKSGTIKFLRLIPEPLRPTIAPELAAAQTWHESAALSVLAQTGIGAYRQHLGDGHTAYALCLLRTKGI